MNTSFMKKSCSGKTPTNRGQAMIIAVVFFLAGSLIVTSGIAAPVLRDLKILRGFEESRQSFYLSEGSVEDVAYRIMKGLNFSAIENLSVNNITASTTVTILTDKREIISVGDKSSNIRKTRILLTQGSGVAFNYGLQAGDGGIFMENFSSISGNVYSNGSTTGSNNNIINGTIVSAGPSGLIDGIHVTDSGYSHTITDSVIDGDVYYQNISGTTVGGVLYPGSADQPTSTLPITDDLISQWESDAEAGGIISSPCPYTINNDETIGPVKINCKLEISGNYTITLNGPVWVVGDVIISNNPVIKTSSSVGDNSVTLISDDPLNRTTSSKVQISNSPTFLGSGAEGSYILIISQNTSAEDGGSEIALNVSNNAGGDLLLYASHGEILLQNSVSLKEVTGYKIHLQNNTDVIYETGLANLLFTSGPSGGFDINSWLEVQ